MKTKLIIAILALAGFGIPATTSATPSLSAAQRTTFAALVADPFVAAELSFRIPYDYSELLVGPGRA